MRVTLMLAGLVTFGLVAATSAASAAASAVPHLVSLTSGSNYSCALTSAGGVRCWGANTHGQLGDGTTTTRLVPVGVVGLSTGVQAIAAGGDEHTCALTATGAVKCWGDNRHGELGDGTKTNRLTPVHVRGLSAGVAKITAGSFQTCAVTAAGAAKCWGANGSGQLGDRTTTDRSTPVAVFGLSAGVAAVSAGYLHTCARTTSGRLQCWGDNRYGALGNGTTKGSTAPVNVLGLTAGALQVTAGTFDTCAITSAGAAKCWGAGGFGQLGDGAKSDRHAPVSVVGLTTGVAQIANRGNHTCARTTAGAVKCWGAGGALGDGTTAPRLTPTAVVGLGSGATNVAVGDLHSCADQPSAGASLLAGGGIVCWGDNAAGEVGNGLPGNALTPAVVRGHLLRLSVDPFTNVTSQHRTQVEPDSFAVGSTIVTAFQSGRFFDGGSSDIGWATSTDGGATWSHGFLPGLTVNAGGGPYDRVSDPSVAYDAAHHTWMVSAIALVDNGGAVGAPAVVVSTSGDGLTWSSTPAVIPGADLDKNWTACDNTPASPHYGHCYTEYDDPANGAALHVAVSSNGGASWVQATVPVATALGGQPLVQPDGTVVIPISSNGGATGFQIESFVSSDGGATFTGPFEIANPDDHEVAGNLRQEAGLTSAEMDGAGRIYVAWVACTFRNNGGPCSANDIVLSTSTDGTTWTALSRVPIDPTTSTADHFIPGIAVDPTTSGAGAHVAITYHYYPDANCTAPTCQLSVGFVASTDGGSTWSPPTQIAGPMSLSWIADTSLGRMVGDYISTSFVAGIAHPVVAVAAVAPSGATFDESAYTTTVGYWR